MPTARTPPTAGKLGPADQPEQGVGDCATLEAAKATASASPASAFRPSRADEHNVFFAKLKKREVGDICIWILRCGGFRYYVRSKSQNQTQSFLFEKKQKTSSSQRSFPTLRCQSGNLEEICHPGRGR